MNVCAALCIYDEPSEFLERCVASLAGFASTVAAFDGRWDGMPGPDTSPDGQQQAVAAAAAAAGVELIADARPWPSQVEKRAALMAEAAKHGDWILVIDGDEHLDRHGDAEVNDESFSGLVSIVNANRPWPHQHLAPMRTVQLRLFRAGVTVIGPAHNDYGHDGQPVADLATVDLSRSLTVVHDNVARPAPRVEAAKSYRRHRRAHRTEARQ